MGMLMRRVGAASLVVVLLAACSGSVNGPVVEGNRSSGGEGAEVFGTLVLEDTCAYLTWTEPEVRYPVIWPHGTLWDADARSVVLPDGTPVYPGDEVYGGGGYHSSNLDQYTSQEGVDLLLSCVDNQYGEIAVFNSSEDVQVLD